MMFHSLKLWKSTRDLNPEQQYLTQNISVHLPVSLELKKNEEFWVFNKNFNMKNCKLHAHMDDLKSYP